jgi:DNA polymerase-3 subunit gamma/tau
MPLALARKYRPTSFGAIAVQTHVSTTLKGAIARGRVAHGYLLCGPRGTGKTTLARVLAMALNCERRAERTDGEPCGECASCRRIWSGSASLDVVEIDAASNRGVDDARELRERAMYAPSGEDRYKVYIIDEAHMLTREAWNALLKVLEEPPPRVVFVFATTEPQRIAQAAAPVLSRLQRFDLKRIGAADIRERLTSVLAAEGIAADAEALAMLARAADGSMRDALSLTDQVLALGDTTTLTPTRVREALGLVPEDEYLAVLELIAEGRAADVFPTVARLGDAGIDFAAFVAGFAEMLRAQLAVVLGGEGPAVSDRARAALVAHRDVWTAADLLRMLTAVTELEPRFRKSTQQQLLLETLLLRCALLDHTVGLEDVLRELGAGGGKPATPREAPARNPGPPAGGGGPARTAGPTAPPQPPVPDGTARPPRPAAAERAADPGVQPTARQTAQPAADSQVLVDRWPVVVNRVRRDRQASMLATALEESTPEWGPAPGTITVRLTNHNEILKRAIESGRADVLAAVAVEWPEVARVEVILADANGPPTAPRRLTAEAVKADQVASLRKRDAVLGAAIDALDLELIE